MGEEKRKRGKDDDTNEIPRRWKIEMVEKVKRKWMTWITIIIKNIYKIQDVRKKNMRREKEKKNKDVFYAKKHTRTVKYDHENYLIREISSQGKKDIEGIKIKKVTTLIRGNEDKKVKKRWRSKLHIEQKI